MRPGMTVSKHKEEQPEEENQPQVLKTAAICNHRQFSLTIRASWGHLLLSWPKENLSCEKFHPKMMCHSSIMKGIGLNKDCWLKHINELKGHKPPFQKPRRKSLWKATQVPIPLTQHKRLQDQYMCRGWRSLVGYVITDGQFVFSLLENGDVVGAVLTGDAPTTSEWSTSLLPTKVQLILEIWQYSPMPWYCMHIAKQWWNINDLNSK